MEHLKGSIRNYAWGSHTALARLQNRPAPTSAPEAELWLGAHPTSPSTICRDNHPVFLTDAITQDPSGLLGGETIGQYGQRLPFLLKVLAAAQPLSLQAHPDSQQAKTGFDREESAGVPLGASERTYSDPWHKPELLVAVEEFDALCGFRDPQSSATLLASLGISALSDIIDALNSSDPTQALRSAVERLLTYPRQLRQHLVDEVVAASGNKAQEHPRYALAGRLANLYPGDIGVIVAMLLNRVTVRPGEAVWMPAGNLHAYLHGVGVEIMATSDNVLRGGLTPKHVNVPELLRILRFEVLSEPILRAQSLAPGVVTWPVPVSDFALIRATVDGGTIHLPGHGPRIILCVRGRVWCHKESMASGGLAGTPGRELLLRGGQAAFVSAVPGVVSLSGNGEIYQASVG